MTALSLGTPLSEQELDGNCDFVAIEDPQIALLDIDQQSLDKDNERITTFFKTLLEYSGIKYFSEENFIVEALTFLLLTCNIDIQDKFQLFYYQLQNDYVPWGFSAPENNDATLIDSVDILTSLIDILMRLDVNRKVLQCHHCRTKCGCDVVATFLVSEIELFTMQDPAQQIVDDKRAVTEYASAVENASNPITLGANKEENFINNETCDIIINSNISSQENSVLNDLDKDNSIASSGEATLSMNYISFPPVPNFDAWKGHNDNGIPIINFDALFGHKAIDDLDLQHDCRV